MTGYTGAITANDKTIEVMPRIRSSDYYAKQYGYVRKRPLGRHDWQFILTLSGAGVVECRDETYHCSAGELVVIPPDIPHGYYTEQNEVWEKIWVHFIPRVAWKPWLEHSFPQDRVMHLHLDQMTHETIEDIFRRILYYYSGKQSVFKQELALNAVEKIILVISSMQSEKSGRQLDLRVEEVLNYLENHFAEPIQIEQLAKMVYLSPSRLTHLFKHEFGESIIETLTKIRVNQAAKLLQSTDRPIVEIAYSVGFHSANFFSRKFVGCYGTNPMSFRKNKSMI